MKPELFDSAIKGTLEHYRGREGVSARLLSASDKASELPPGNWISVTVLVAPVVPHAKPYAETWYYGGVIQKERTQPPLGIRVINDQRLIGATEATKQLPLGFPLTEASCELYWALTPEMPEPAYVFHHGDTVIRVGAYGGTESRRVGAVKDSGEDGVHYKGLLSMTAKIKPGGGNTAADVLGWDYVIHGEDQSCYSYYAAQPPLIGLTQQQQVPCPLGVRVFDQYRISFSKAIKLMHTSNSGDTFVSMSLSWPLTPTCTEPYWHIRTSIGNDISIGANTGEMTVHPHLRAG